MVDTYSTPTLLRLLTADYCGTGLPFTVDGLPLFFALSFLSRYHLTQLLVPKLLAADKPRVAMLTATLDKIADLKKIYELDLKAEDSHQLREK